MTQNQWGNLNKDFIKAVRGGGVTVLWKYFIKFRYFLKDGFPKNENKNNIDNDSNRERTATEAIMVVKLRAKLLWEQLMKNLVDLG